MNPRERLLRVVGRESVDMAPVLTFFSTATLELMSISGAWRPQADSDPNTMARLALACNRYAGFEAIKIPFGPTVLDEIMGCGVDFGDQSRTRAVTGSAIQVGDPYPDVPDDLSSRGRIPVVLNATKIIRQEVGDELPIIALVEGPGDLASNMCGIQEFLMGLITDREWIDGLLDIACDIVQEYGRACSAAGADIVGVAESMTSCSIISPEDFKGLIKQRYQRLAQGMRDYAFLSLSGDVRPIWQDMIDCGFDGLIMDNEKGEADLDWLLGRAHRAGLPVAGSLSSSQTLYFGGVEDLKEEVFRDLKAGMDIISPGGGFPPDTPVEKLRAILSARDEFFDR